MCVSGSRGEQQKLFFVIGFAVAYSDWIVFVSKKKKKKVLSLAEDGLEARYVRCCRCELDKPKPQPVSGNEQLLCC